MARTRRYDQVDPDNRLVVQELEKDWEDKLRQLQVAQEGLERLIHEHPEVQLTPSLREQLSHLNRELPKLWTESKLTNQHKKQLLRTLIEKVVLKRTAPDQVQVKVVWVSTHFSEGDGLSSHLEASRYQPASGYGRSHSAALAADSDWGGRRDRACV